MTIQAITVVRIYLTEGRDHSERLLKWLHDDGRVRGATVFRAIEGFGQDGKIKTASLMALTLELPIVIEFFDTPDNVSAVLDEVQKMVNVDHIVSWSANSGI